MSRSFETETKTLSLELKGYRARAEANHRRQEDRLFDTQLSFWIESSRFFIAELEIWDKRGNETKCHQALHRARESLNQLQELLD